MSERPSICTFINGERAKILSAGQGRLLLVLLTKVSLLYDMNGRTPKRLLHGKVWKKLSPKYHLYSKSTSPRILLFN